LTSNLTKVKISFKKRFSIGTFRALAILLKLQKSFFLEILNKCLKKNFDKVEEKFQKRKKIETLKFFKSCYNFFHSITLHHFKINVKLY
jgi:hypothetical protein